jgi:hypothetical protein
MDNVVTPRTRIIDCNILGDVSVRSMNTAWQPPKNDIARFTTGKRFSGYIKWVNLFYQGYRQL